ncbi:MAG: glycosyltransferase [Phycisphaerae bacterium]|nr:glycosyltransferase [Phycisphaerae bacterium]NIP51206.1 glycosyltransferase [Phycisphaerae bacterium]NIS50417.1 glycosyltransferase [Phycisphaerae bacterium]NIU08147.1 glycosyltransferase [Phycisphaerae bacterium]NIU55690.1 glycosyltransferase [Phycisphaerae bacterium]
MQETDINKNESLPDADDKKKVLIFVVCYNAEKWIESVLDRIPNDVLENKNFSTEILVIDDQSPDRTFYAAEDYARRRPEIKINVLYNPKNQGYGGNQKIGYCYALRKGFDAVVLLHGDGQYAPEYLGQMIQPILDEEADAVFGSRMIHRLDALKGRMPLYKWIGNQLITWTQNRIMKSRLSEFHSGYRAYNTKTLASIPFEHNSNYFDFDTDIIIQLLDTKKRIKEIPIPTYYGNEICRVNGIKYAIRIICSCILSRVIRLGIYYHPKFDYQLTPISTYQAKLGYPSSHQFALSRVTPSATVLDVGCGSGLMAEHLANKDVKTISIDKEVSEKARQASLKWLEVDVEQYDFSDDFGDVDYILLLDIIEHLKSPERFLRILRDRYSRSSPEFIITTANIGFFIIRSGLLFGSFNYGRRGILDMDHSRLFTFSTLRRTLELCGYELLSKKGIPAPFPLAIGDGWLARFLLQINRFFIFFSKSLFSYQIAVTARPLPTLEHLLKDAHEAKEQKLSDPTLPKG